MVKRRGLKEKLEIFSWSFSTEESTRLVADVRATFAGWVDWTRAVAGVADGRTPPVSVCEKKKKNHARGWGSNPRRVCQSSCERAR